MCCHWWSYNRDKCHRKKPSLGSKGLSQIYLSWMTLGKSHISCQPIFFRSTVLIIIDYTWSLWKKFWFAPVVWLRTSMLISHSVMSHTITCYHTIKFHFLTFAIFWYSSSRLYLPISWLWFRQYWVLFHVVTFIILKRKMET